jgi:SAM-dependent methyltransferase
MPRNDEQAGIEDYWSRRIEESDAGRKDTGKFWWNAGPDIYAYRNRRISGDPAVGWVEYTLQTHLADRLPLHRCLSLGCGGGRLERKLAGLGTFVHCDAYDASAGAVLQARQIASTQGYDIEYYVADINTLELPAATYDAVWASQALHHFEALEHVCDQVNYALKPGGMLIVEEYAGPNRFQFPARQRELANLCLALLPTKYRRKVTATADRYLSLPRGRRLASRLVEKLKDGSLPRAVQRRIVAAWSRATGRPAEKTTIHFPTVADVVAIDPTEAVCSAQIVEVLRQKVEIVEERGWGGNILQFVLADIAGNFREGDPYLKMLISIEEAMLEAGEFPDDHVYVVAQPRNGR